MRSEHMRVIERADILSNYVKVDKSIPRKPIYTLEESDDASEAIANLLQALNALQQYREKDEV